MDSITLAGAFLGGLLSFFSPCTLPLLPSLVTFLQTEDEVPRLDWRRWVLFWLGFTIVFILMGSVVSTLGELFFEYQTILQKVSGVFVILMGFFLLGLGMRSFLSREYRPLLGKNFRKAFSGPSGAFFLGIAFTVGWTPCSGPILAAVLAVAGNGENPTAGAVLLAAYAIGFGVPFGILTIFFDRLFVHVKGIFPYLVWIQRIAGVLLIILGILIYLDKLGPLILRYTI